MLLMGCGQLQYCQEQGLGRFAELVDQLVMPGAESVSQAVCQLQGLTTKEFAAFKHHAHVLAANKWNSIQLAPLFYERFKTHRLFTDLPFFQNEEAVRCDLHPLQALGSHGVYLCGKSACHWLQVVRGELDSDGITEVCRGQSFVPQNVL